MHDVTSCYHDGGGNVTFDLAPEAMRAALARPASLLWVDIVADGRDDGEIVLRDIFGFHPLTIDDCYNTLIDPPKVDDYGDYLFIIVHNVLYDANTQLLSTNELNLYVGANYVVSVHRSPVRAIGEVRRRAELHALVLERGAGFLAHALIDVVVDDFHPVVETIDDQVATIEEQVLDNPQRATLAAVLRLKRNAQRLKRSI